jgi:hypothetical protein
MTDVLVPVFIPYARFLEARARRVAIAIELMPTEGPSPNAAVSSASAPVAADESSGGAAVRVLPPAGQGGVQP